MNPPRRLIDRLLADGEKGILTSIICLSAALAVKRGGSTDLTSIETTPPLSPAMKARARDGHALAVEMYRHATPLELDCAIALFGAHLKAAGFTYTAGRDN